MNHTVMKKIVHLFLGGLFTVPFAWSQDSELPSTPEYEFAGERISSSTKDGTTLTQNETTDIAGSLQFDFVNQDTSPDDDQVGTYLPGENFSLSFTSSNIFNSASGTNFNFASSQETILGVRNNLPEQLSPEQTQGADVIDINIEIRRSFFRGSDSGHLNLQLIDSTGTALDSDELPESLDFSKFDTILLFHARNGVIGSGTFAVRNISNYLTASITLDTPPPSDTPLLTVSAPPINEGLIGYPVTFNLSQPASGGERFSFEIVSNQANLEEDFQAYSEFHEFSAGETSLTLLFTLRDDAVIEPDETFNLVLSDPIGLELAQSTIALTILNDDTLLDDYGNRYGLGVEERRAFVDDDNDGLQFIAEYGFNLDPTVSDFSLYDPDVTYSEENHPKGLPVLIKENGAWKYLYPRRTDAAPRIEYIAELSIDGQTFSPIAENKTTPLTDNWEEVEILLPSNGDQDLPEAFLRVCLISNEE